MAAVRAESLNPAAAIHPAALFGLVVLLQLGHLLEHISKALLGHGLFGPDLDSETSHLLFNGAIALLALALVHQYRRNVWVYPLALVATLHGIEHAYIYEQFIRTAVTDGPGLLGSGGAIPLIPLARLDLHNIYNGGEVVLLTLGLQAELDRYIE